MQTQSFTDTQKKNWTVNVTVSTLKRVKAALGIDMLDIDTFLKQVQDPISLCDILYLACKDEADREGISDEQFGGRLSGPSLRDGKNALMEAYINFIPDPVAAEKIRVVKEKYDQVGEKILAILDKRMPEIVDRIDAEVETFADKIDAELGRMISGK